MMLHIRPLLVVFSALTVLTGVLYPLAITGLGFALFPGQANGSLVLQDGRPIGSVLIGQQFSQPGYFWSRPSATGTAPYNALASGGSNQGPLNPALFEAVNQRIQALQAADPENSSAVPVDLVTASASGLDPHISRAAADYQIDRVARARGLENTQVAALVAAHTSARWLGLLGEPTVNVLELNLALDSLASGTTP
jgi:K+-transporting ATPase ATPase C chain